MHRSCSPSFIAAAVVFAFGAVSPGFAADKLYVQTPAKYDKDSGVNDKVKQECALDEKIPHFVQENAKGKFDVTPSKTLGDAGNSKALSLTIINVVGGAGGAWSGPKIVTLQGPLKEQGKVVGTFTARRSSSGGAWGGYKGTCSIFGRDAETLGKDVAAWLAAPTMDAKLGELK